MPESLDCEEFDFLLVNTSKVPPETNAKCQRSQKRLRIAELIAQNDGLVRQTKELQEQLCGIQRTASEVTGLYQQEKQQRIALERRALEQSEHCADLEKQLDVLNLNCEQLQEQLRDKGLPVDAKDMIGIFMQLTQRIAADTLCSGLTRAEQIMQRKLKDYCKSANISIPPPKSPAKKRIKVSVTAQATQTQDLTAMVPSKSEMCSIAVQCGSMVTTRDQGIQHKNTTTTRGTTTSSFIKMHDVGTCFPEPKPPLNVNQILEKMRAWNITPLSPISDPPPAMEQLPTISVGTCTDLCNVHREIDFLPELPAQLKCSDSRPPSRTMYSSVKDELAMPADAAALGGYSHNMAKELLSILPHNQSVLAKMPPQVFDEIWQVMGQMVLVALQGRSTNSISQADFRSWFDALYESHQAPSERSSSTTNNIKEPEFMTPLDEDAVQTDAGTDPILEPLPKIGLELTPIRLPLKPMPKIKPKKRKRRVAPYSRLKTQEQKSIATPTSPTETAIQFLSNLNAFHNPNCDNLDIQLDAEERQLLQLATATSKTVACEQSAAQSPPEEAHQYMNQQLPVETVDRGSSGQCLDTQLKEEEHKSRAKTVDSDVESPVAEADQLMDINYSTVDNQPLMVKTVDYKEINPRSPAINDPQILDTQLKAEEQKLIDINCTTPVDCPATNTESAGVDGERVAAGNKDQLFSLFGSDVDSDDEAAQEQTSDCDARSIECANLVINDDEPNCEALPKGEDSSSSLSVGEREASTAASSTQLMRPFGRDTETEDEDRQEEASASDADSVDSCSLIIDVANEDIQLLNDIEEPPAKLEVGKRKRKSSMTSTSSDSQPVEKRLTRLQAKQLLLGAEKHESIEATSELRPSCFDDCSPQSPVAVTSCEESDEPIEIPLEPPGGEHSDSAPKPLLYYLVNAVKAGANRIGQRKRKPGKKQLEQLHPKIVDYLQQSVPLDLASVQFAKADEQNLINVLITAYGELRTVSEDGSTQERLLAVIKRSCLSIERCMNTLEQRLFNPKARLADQVAQRFVRLYLQLIGLQAGSIRPAESYVNPARLLLAKILYHYSNQMVQLVREVLCHFPTVLPHREERDYDHADPLITVIKHLLMAHKYDVSDPNGPGRALISMLRFEYHFQPFEPTTQQVIENLVEKLKAGRLHQLSYAFALFCKRSGFLNVKNMLAEHLMPLVNSYCDLCIHNEEYDARMECLLQCISMIVKQLPLDGMPDIPAYIAVYKRVLVAVPRSGVQQAAIQAILRTQRFGYAFAMDALNGYRPRYELSPLTRAMLRSFVERRREYQRYPSGDR